MALGMVLPLVAPAALAADGDAGVGKKLYVANCQSCHGNKGQGAVGKRLAGDAAYWDFPIFKRTVIEGIDDENRRMKVMPVFGKVGLSNPKGHVPSDADLENLQAYLKTFAPPE
jgi:mono/diheme cytochrome c family protein